MTTTTLDHTNVEFEDIYCPGDSSTDQQYDPEPAAGQDLYTITAGGCAPRDAA